MHTAEKAGDSPHEARREAVVRVARVRGGCDVERGNHARADRPVARLREVAPRANPARGSVQPVGA